MHPDLFAYQRLGAEWMADHYSPHVLLGDEMGVGKSATAIAGSDLVGAKSVLVLCPGIARVNWAREYAHWQTNKRTVGISFGSNDIPSTDVVIASYALLPRKKALAKLLSRKWDLIISDEAHFLKNRDSATCRAAYGYRCEGKNALVSKTKRFWLLSGTPIPNNLSEMWTHTKALWPEACAGLERYRQWLDHFCIYEDTEYGTRVLRCQRKDDFVRRVKPFVLRRRFSDVHKDMPAARISQVVVKPDTLPPMPEGMAETEKIVRAALAKSIAGSLAEAKAAMASIDGMHLSTLRKWTGIAKAPAVAEQLCADIADGMGKVVVFAVHTEVIDILAKALPHCAVIDGRTPTHKRDPIIDAFQGKVPGRRIDQLIVHITIGSTALTLTAAHHAVFAEVTWVPKDLAQAIGRLRRIGQKRTVLARIFSLKGSIDEQVGATLLRKTKEITEFDEALAA